MPTLPYYAEKMPTKSDGDVRHMKTYEMVLNNLARICAAIMTHYFQISLATLYGKAQNAAAENHELFI